MATIFRPPVTVKIPKLPSQQPDAVINLRVLLSPNPAEPFRQDDWPSCARGRPAQASDAPANRLPFTTLPFGQDDWPSTERPRYSDRGDADDGLALLAPNPARPFAASDWPTAATRKKAALTDQASNRLPHTTLPFRQSDWPLPGRRRPIQSDIIVNLLPLQAVPVVAAPFRQDEWHLCTRRGWAVRITEADAGLALREPNPAAPFLPLEWPPPSRLAESSVSRSFFFVGVPSITAPGGASIANSVADAAIAGSVAGAAIANSAAGASIA